MAKLLLFQYGGEIHFYDVYANCRDALDQSSSLQMSRAVWGSGMGGAYWRDTVEALDSIGFSRPRFIKQIPASVNNKELKKEIGQYVYLRLYCMYETYTFHIHKK